jgi:lincosamide nucleotidyltransferase
LQNEVIPLDKKTLLIRRLEQISEAVRNSGNALAFLALGSCGQNRERLDEYSDLDFFVIVKEGYKEQYIDRLDWITGVSETGYYFKNTPDGYKLLFKDGVFCEFAVFEPGELEGIPAEKGLFLWKAEGFQVPDKAGSIISDEKPAPQEKDTQWVIGEALTNLYVGLERYHRGEKLSAYRFVQAYAFDRIMDLISLLEKEQPVKRDIFDNSRRFESRFPGMSKELHAFLQGYDKIPESAKAILEFLDSHFSINAYIKESILELL